MEQTIYIEIYGFEEASMLGGSSYSALCAGVAMIIKGIFKTNVQNKREGHNMKTGSKFEHLKI